MDFKYVFLMVLGVFAAALLLAQHAEAGEREGLLGMGDTYLYTGAWSTHPMSDEDYKSRHDLLAVDYRSYMAGYFRNSYGDDTFFLAKNFTTRVRDWPIEAGVSLGASYGYGHCYKDDEQGTRNKVCPFGYGSLFYTEKDFQVGVIYNIVVLAAAVRWRL